MIYSNILLNSNKRREIKIIKDDAKKLGIKEENIIDNNICTLCNRKLFNSHRNNDIELNYALIIKR